jgi:hypothetical protein
MSDLFWSHCARRYAVFHATCSHTHRPVSPQSGDLYVHVADVDALSIDDVIAITTSAGGSWPSHPAVVWAASGVQRATTDGDLICSYESESLWVVQGSRGVRLAFSPGQLGLEWRSL